MTDELEEPKLLEQQDRGQAAQDLLNNPLFIEAFEALEAALFDGWKMSEGPDRSQRENAYLMMRLSGNLRQWFQTHIANGSAASTILLQITQQQTKIRKVNG